MKQKILVVGDCQVKPNEDLTFLDHIGQYIIDKRPDVVVCIGDFWDFPSLSSYDKGKRSFEGRRLLADLKAGNEGMERLLAPLKGLQRQQRANRKRVYSPRLVFTLGNHEDRADRAARDAPELDGLIGTHMMNLDDHGWEVYPFLKPVEIAGIYFVHYLANPMTGKPYSGTAMNQLKTVGKSFCVGHKQVLDFAIRPTIDGKMQIGIVNGACYPHDEDYKGFQGNNHFRGLIMLHEAEDGFCLPLPVSLDYLEERYGD